MEINLDDILTDVQTSESSEEVEVAEEILDEQTNESEEIEETTEEVEESEETEEVEETIDFGDVEIQFQDDERTKLSDFTPEEVKRYIQMGMKDEFQENKTNVRANDTVSAFDSVAELYGIDTEGLLEELKSQIFATQSEEGGRHVDDIRKDFDGNHKSFKERSINRLLDANSDLTYDTIPKEVLNDLKLGKDIVNSYNKHLLTTENGELKDKLAKLEKDLKVKKQNEKAKKKTFVKKKSGSVNQGSSLLSEIDKILKL